jgi:RNA polymerase sigma-70 factor (ECF subfamily)
MSLRLHSSVGDLIVAARAGNREARGELLSHYRRHLELLARARLHQRLQGKTDAADIVQETCLQAHRHFGTFRGRTEAELIAWLRSIVKRLLANHARHFLATGRRDARLERPIVRPADAHLATPCEPLALDSSPADEALRHEAVMQLRAAIEELPSDYRRVIDLRMARGLSYADVALQMGRSVDGVQKLWIRSLAQLRRRLETNELDR